MLGAYAQSCCCGPVCEKDCIWGTEIESGCCHKSDTLLLWCERNGFSYRYTGGCTTIDPVKGTTTKHQTCCDVVQVAEEPIQAIYHYHSCWWRCIKIGFTGIGGLDGLAEMCPPEVCRYDENGNPTACNGYYDCAASCGPIFPTCCNDPDWVNNCVDCCASCNDEGMSEWRRIRQGTTDQWKWINESVCHKQGQDLGSGDCCETISFSGGSFTNCQRLGGLNRANQMLAVVHFERWWRIADCADGVRIYVPGCDQIGGDVDCGGNTYQTDDLVPKWWIFACSGIPLYAGDLIDAVRFGVITGTEATQFLEDLFGACSHPSQDVLYKLANAGYIRANDWRDEQRTAYQELDARFPGAGYSACIQNVDQMHTLGPFRKRMTCSDVGVTNQPFLRKADVVSSYPDLTPLQADCFINYPGPTTGSTAQSDYDYWCERQWVYFRGRPGGWTWAGWAANVCEGDEELSILLGDGRGDTSCIQALQGGGRSPAVYTACACCEPDPADVGPLPYDEFVCHGCGSPPCAIPYPSCAPPNTCELFSAKPFCEGMWFKFFNYKADMFNVYPDGSTCNFGPECGLCYKIRCILESDSYLVEARRSVDSWDTSIPFTCRNESPALPVFDTWGVWAQTHVAPIPPICNLFDNPGQDTTSWCWGCGCQEDGAPPCSETEYSDRACCGAKCPDYECDCDPTSVNPWKPINTECTTSANCPPHSTQDQIGCIGFTPNC